MKFLTLTYSFIGIATLAHAGPADVKPLKCGDQAEVTCPNEGIEHANSWVFCAPGAAPVVLEVCEYAHGCASFDDGDVAGCATPTTAVAQPVMTVTAKRVVGRGVAHICEGSRIYCATSDAGDVIAHCEKGQEVKVVHQCAQGMHCAFSERPNDWEVQKIYCKASNSKTHTWMSSVTGMPSPTPSSPILKTSVTTTETYANPSPTGSTCVCCAGTNPERCNACDCEVNGAFAATDDEMKAAKCTLIAGGWVCDDKKGKRT